MNVILQIFTMGPYRENACWPILFIKFSYDFLGKFQPEQVRNRKFIANNHLFRHSGMDNKTLLQILQITVITIFTT